MHSPATRPKRAMRAATAMSRSPSARANYLRKFVNSCPTQVDRRCATRPALVVDDVPDNLDILQMRLESQGYEIATAGDGVEALEKIRKLLPDLVLLDIMMPKMGRLIRAPYPFRARLSDL